MFKETNMCNAFRNNIKSFSVVLFVTLIIGMTCIGETIAAINLSVNNLSPNPGESITFTADISGTNVVAVLTDDKKINIEDNVTPYEWTISIPDFASGTKSFRVLAIIDGLMEKSNEITVTVKPNFDELQQILFEQNRSVYLSPGSYKKLRIIGRFSDGHNRNLTKDEMGTSYTENIVDGLNVTQGDSPVISVTKDGLLRGHQPGVAEVVANNSGKFAILRVMVEAIDNDDADGDGINDDHEDSIGTDKYSPDTDEDGVLDGLEIGLNNNDPLDYNNDGIIDAVDSQTLIVKDVTGKFVSIHTSSGTLSSLYSQKLKDFPERKNNLEDILMECGVLGFSVKEINPGQKIDITLSFESLPNGTNKYLKYGPRLPEDAINFTWYDFPNITIDGNNIILHLTDNELGDSNPTPGVISDPGGPGKSTIVNDKEDFSTSGPHLDCFVSLTTSNSIFPVLFNVNTFFHFLLILLVCYFANLKLTNSKLNYQ